MGNKNGSQNFGSAKFNHMKSNLIIKKVYALITIKKKLKIIIYNNKLKKVLNYDIEDYKKLSRREIIFEKKGKGKEYVINTNILIFEGKYKNKKRNGKGREYFINGKLKSEGNYLKGKKNGVFKEYYLNGEIKFEGEYLNGNKIKGKEYDENKNLITEIDNNGKIKKYFHYKDYNVYECHLIFEGEFINNNKIKGKEFHINGNIKFDGEFLNGLRWNGKIYNDKSEFEGEYINGKKFIKGKEYADYFDNSYYNREITNFKEYNYEDRFLFSVEKGRVKEYYKNGNIKFEGEYLYGRRLNGTMYNYEGKIEFEFKYGKGEGKEYDEDGNIIYNGQYLYGEKNGKGREYSYSGDLIYEGEFMDGKRNGIGKEYKYKDELIFQGEFFNGERWNGKGKENIVNKFNYEGEYLNGKKWNGRFYVEDENENEEYILKNGKGFVREYRFIDYSENCSFEGLYMNGERNGYGREYAVYDLFTIKLVYEGGFLNGIKHGYGIEYGYDYSNEFYYISFKGEFLNGKRWNGEAKEYDKDKNLIFDGKYINGKIYDK